MQITRDSIIAQLATGLAEHPAVHALWLEGADGTGAVDAYSDLDIVIDASDGAEDAVFAASVGILAELGPLDFAAEGPRYHNQLRTQFLHIAGTPDWLFIDLTVQSHSRQYEFVREDADTMPKVLFDKSGVVKFRHLDRAAFQAELSARIPQLEQTVAQRSRAVKYALRGQFLEAMAYYHKFVLSPLVEALRMRYAPVNHDMWLIHISRHLPAPVLHRLEALYQVGSTDDIQANIPAACAWFDETLAQVRAGLAANQLP